MKQEETTQENAQEALSFEQKIEQAKVQLEKLIDPKITLSDSVEVYKAGMSELNKAQEMLENAKFEFEELNKA
jgi:exodeoxyribonuclease VII small subunit